MAFEGKQIQKQEHTPDFRHPQINGAFKPLEPTGNALAAAGQYSQIAQKWREGVTDFAARMNRASAAAWEGQAAERSREAIKNYTQRATELTPELESLATRVGETAQAITTTKDRLPAPGQNFEFTSPSTWDVWNNEDPDDQEEAARQVMAEHYVKPFTTADGAIPVLPTPVSPTNPLHGAIDDGTGGDGTDGDGTDGGGTDDGDGSGTTDPAATEDPAVEEEPEDTAEGGDDSDDDTSSEDDEDGADDDSADDETAPSSATPESAVAPAATSPASAAPSTGSPGGGSGGGGGSPGSAVAAPVPGRAVAGSPVMGTPAGVAGAGSASSSSGRSGMPGMMGAPGAGRGKGGDDDDTHEIPDYLITAENTEELLGEMPNTIAGGVIGGDAPSANTSPDAPRPRN